MVYCIIRNILGLFKLYAKGIDLSKPVNAEKNKYYYSKDFPVSTREWYNSIYIFNKISLPLLTQATISTSKLIRSYLNLYNINIERKMRKTRLLRRSRKLSSHRTYVSNGELKHTNDKVVITLYTYDRQKYNYLTVLRERYISLFYKEKTIKELNERFFFFKDSGSIHIKEANRDKFTLIKTLKSVILKNKHILAKHKSLYINRYLVEFYKMLVRNSLQKFKLYLYYRQLLYINESKYKYTYLQFLIDNIQKIYNKKVEFNFINLKYNYINSDILSESLTLKISKNRRKILKYLNKLIWKIKTHKTRRNVHHQPCFNKLGEINNINDPLESLFENIIGPLKETLKNVVLEGIKYKRIAGVRLEASGRLTRRYTASRSISRLIFKGSLANEDSSYKGLSTAILKGNLIPNLQYSKLSYKTRIGSFGIKGLVSGS